MLTAARAAQQVDRGTFRHCLSFLRCIAPSCHISRPRASYYVTLAATM